jgi:hypothetical protein
MEYDASAHQPGRPRVNGGKLPAMHEDVIDEVLSRFSAKGPEFGPGLSNHGPMAADALVALGRADAVVVWSEWYSGRLAERPEARQPIASQAWAEALGDIGRAGDWVRYFEREIDAQPWRDVLDAWVARLVPGIMAGATHGILRTAHAVRSLERGETPARRYELAEGLGYWAARYQTLPSAPAAPGALRISQALDRVERVGDGHRASGLIFDAMRAVDTTPFDQVINYVAVDGNVDRFVDDVTRAFVRQYIANAARASIAFIHTVTAPSSLRLLAPHLSETTTRSAMRYAWQACAAVYATYARPRTDEPPAAFDAMAFDEADLIDQAVSARDEHAIKFTEACLREHARSGDAAFITAARDVVGRLRVRS